MERGDGEWRAEEKGDRGRIEIPLPRALQTSSDKSYNATLMLTHSLSSPIDFFALKFQLLWISRRTSKI